MSGVKISELKEGDEIVVAHNLGCMRSDAKAKVEFTKGQPFVRCAAGKHFILDHEDNDISIEFKSTLERN